MTMMVEMTVVVEVVVGASEWYNSNYSQPSFVGAKVASQNYYYHDYLVDFALTDFVG